MDMNEYTLDVVVRDRLAEMRADGERTRRIRIARPASRPLRVALGHALIRLGRRLQGVGGSLDGGGAVDTPRASTPGAVHG
ncbi:MAG TPA: hypothetical protein VFV05_15030 [Methylomirabilota bacterium]|nr:hypothetical protein [Methylomirabilota bacterium]